jgi:hypothetical protein
MHEEALYRDLRRRLDELGKATGVSRITRAEVWVGALAHVDPEGLRTRWTELVRGGRAEGAELVIERSEDPTDPRAEGVVLRNVRVLEAPDNEKGGPPLARRGPREERCA